MSFITKDIESVLIKNNLFKAEEIKEFQKEALVEKLSLFDYILEKKKTTPEKLAEIFSKEFSINLISEIEESEVDINLLAKIPLKFLRDNSFFQFLNDEKLTVIIGNPCNNNSLEELKIVIGSFNLLIGSKIFISELINRYYPIEGTKKVFEELEAEGDNTQAIDFNVISEEDVFGLAQEAPVIKLVNNILFQAVKRWASDIHIEPFEKELRIRYRIDGSLYIIMNPPKRIQGALSSRLKIMAKLNIAEKRQPQYGRIQISISNKPIDIRVSILPVVHGESIVMRLLDKSRSFVALEEIGLNERDLLVVKDAISQPNWIVLVTGPTG